MNLKLQSKGKILVAEYLTFLLNLIPRLLPKLEHHLLKQRRWDYIKPKRRLETFFSVQNDSTQIHLGDNGINWGWSCWC